MAARRPPKPAGTGLFEAARAADPAVRETVPLAERLRPRTLADLVGQRHLLGPDAALARAVTGDRVRSMILWGPPGAGKTTLARVIAESTRARFVALNAVLGGVADVREATAAAREARTYQGQRTILFIDEIHRFNKSQQDALLPQVEDGTFTLVGATTENPSFAVVAPLLSRCKVFRLQPLGDDDVLDLLRRALAHPDGLAGRIDADPEALGAIARLAKGDARRALTSLDLAADEVLGRGERHLGLGDVAAQGEHRTLLYDKAGEEHYNVISALIKSMRGSDPDASIYWLLRMLEAGDDPLFVLRRLMIFASEDVGNADPRALEITVAADAAFRRMGMPEGMYPIAQACLYLATAPKSNACNAAWHEAQAAVREHGALPVPLSLRNAVTKLAREDGYGEGYRYAHDEADGVARGATYLPDELAGQRFYRPPSRGYEKTIGERMRFVRGEAVAPTDVPAPTAESPPPRTDD